MNEDVASELMALTQKWANAALTNNANIMLEARNAIAKTLKAFDDANGTSELKKDADMLERSI